MDQSFRIGEWQVRPDVGTVTRGQDRESLETYRKEQAFQSILSDPLKSEVKRERLRSGNSESGMQGVWAAVVAEPDFEDRLKSYDVAGYYALAKVAV